MVIDAFNQKVSSLAKTIACEKNDFSLFKENIIKLDTHVDALYFFNALQSTSYVVNDYENKNGSSALDFTKTKNKISDISLVSTSGYSVSIPHEKIMQLSSSTETENSLISNMLKELYLSSDRDLVKNTVGKLLEGRVTGTIQLNDENGVTNILPELLGYVNYFTSYTDKFLEDDAKNIYSTKKEDVVILVNPLFYNTLLSISIKNADISMKIIEKLNIKYIENVPLDKIIIYDKNYLNIFSQDETLEMIKNPKYNFTNYFLRVKNTIALNPFYKSIVLSVK